MRFWLTPQTSKKKKLNIHKKLSNHNLNQVNLHWESDEKRRFVHTMKKQNILVILFLAVLLINYSEEQGSASNSIAAYITLFKYRKQQRLERQKRKEEKRKEEKLKQSTEESDESNSSWRPSQDTTDFQTIGYNCAKFPFYYSSCIGNNYYNDYWLK